MKETITIDKEMYDKLIEDSDFLSCLQCCGVDNWEGYSDAQEMYDEEYGEDE
jgi:hypothetical protein